MFFAGLTLILCSIIFIQAGANSVVTYIGAVGYVLGYTLLMIGYVLSQGKIADIEERLIKLEKKMEDKNDEKTAMQSKRS